jgi:hypothetical protein
MGGDENPTIAKINPIISKISPTGGDESRTGGDEKRAIYIQNRTQFNQIM